MPRFAPLVAALALSAACCPTTARTVWICGLNHDLVQLVCVADVEPATDAAPARKGTFVNGTAFPLDPTRTYAVNLWSPPTDLPWVELLARSTICYRTPDCEVVMAPITFAPHRSR